MEKDDIVFESLILELRRGSIVLGVLSQLRSPQYGYSLVVLLEEKGFPVDSGTLYPLLRRLEKQGLLESSWDVESTKPRKYYGLSDYGRTIYEELCRQWFAIVGSINNLINEEGK
jgi:DNA-binding PadR family transcriptional regulator